MSVQTIGELLRAYVLADTTVGSLVSTRMYPLRLPEKAIFPALVYTRISDVRQDHLHGPATASEPRYQIDCWADTWGDVWTLSAAVRNRLDAFVGTWTDAASPAVAVSVAVRLISQQDFFEEDILGGKCRNSSDYFVFHGTDAGRL